MFFSVLLLFISDFFKPLLLGPCADMRLFIYKICTGKRSGPGPTLQSWPCLSSQSRGGRGISLLQSGERKGLRGIEISKDMSKYLQVPRQKNVSTVLSWG